MGSANRTGANDPGKRRRRRRHRGRGGFRTPTTNHDQEKSSSTSSNSGAATGAGSTADDGNTKRQGRGQGRRGGKRRDNTQRRSKRRDNNRQRSGRPSSATSGSRSRTHRVARTDVSNETSAGGLVISGLAEAVGPDGTVDLSSIYVALIGRLDKRGRILWSMPKGHIEEGENKATTAEREVWEETGIRGKVIGELGTIDYSFVSDGHRIHKTVHHHLLAYVDGNFNDEDPEVTEVTWVKASELADKLAYADERRLARTAHALIPAAAIAAKAAGRMTPR